MCIFAVRRTMQAGRFVLLAIAVLSLFSVAARSSAESPEDNPDSKTVDWPVYGGQPANDHYSSLAQINRENVHQLHVAWTYDTGEKGEIETSPVIVGNVLYAYTPTQKVIALDSATGRLLWKFDVGIKGTQPARGVAYWTDGKDRRLFAGMMNYLYALDPATGKPIPSFGENGRIDLRKGLGGDYQQQSIALTTPGAIYKNLIIVGGRNPETHPAPPGYIRAFDVRTGALCWEFHTIPRPGEFGYDTWPKDAWKNGAGAANNWTGMSVDTQRGIVYVPTGSAVFDFYGGDRVGNDLFADTLLALDAATGKRIWYFQGVHHDIWDRDFPAPPTLITVKRDGRQIDAVAQTTKQGYLYLFDRTNGQPLFPIGELKYPPSNVPGEVTSPTQPRPTMPEPYSRQVFTENMLTNRTPEAHAAVLKAFAKYISQGQFIPFSVDKLTVLQPGFDGGAEWGGSAADPNTGVLYLNANDIPWLGGLVVPPPPGSLGEQLYQNNCSVCHGINRAGSSPSFPSLVSIGDQLSDQQIEDTIHQGKGRMPSFNNFDDAQMKALINYLKNAGSPDETAPAARELAPAAQGKPNPNANDVLYKFTGYRKFEDPEGYPAIVPPWGTLNAIDLNTGKYLWKIPFGEYPELVAKGMRDTGSESYGGPIVTGGGLVFIGASLFDRKFHAYDSSTGKLLWEDQLPFAGLATPATYMVNSKQYVVIAASGGKDQAPAGGVYVAYALQ
jgi:quinoprotein glucose dehydrogenase